MAPDGPVYRWARPRTDDFRRFSRALQLPVSQAAKIQGCLPVHASHPCTTLSSLSESHRSTQGFSVRRDWRNDGLIPARKAWDQPCSPLVVGAVHPPCAHRTDQYFCRVPSVTPFLAPLTYSRSLSSDRQHGAVYMALSEASRNTIMQMMMM